MKLSMRFLICAERSPDRAACLRASRKSAPRSTLTSGPFPEISPAWSSPASASVATRSPTNVFPAPGTPVTMQIAFPPLSLADAAICTILLEVAAKLSPLASELAISSTRCPGEQRASRLNDRRCRPIRRSRPRRRVQRHPINPRKTLAHPYAKVLPLRSNGKVNVIIATNQIRTRSCIRRHQHRHDHSAVAAAMKVFQVEAVIRNLIQPPPAARFEFQNKNDRSHDYHSICPPPHARYGELQIHIAIQARQRRPQRADLIEPGIFLLRRYIEVRIGDKLAQDQPLIGLREIANACAIPCARPKGLLWCGSFHQGP